MAGWDTLAILIFKASKFYVYFEPFNHCFKLNEEDSILDLKDECAILDRIHEYTNLD